WVRFSAPIFLHGVSMFSLCMVGFLWLTNFKVKLLFLSVLPAGKFSKVVSSSGKHETKLGNVTIQVVTGDITKETTDVIVNSSNDSFTLKSGVSKAILDAAGVAVLEECQYLGSQPHQGMIMTVPGNLKCKKILHLVVQSDKGKIHSSVKEALQMCVKHSYTSVSFPIPELQLQVLQFKYLTIPSTNTKFLTSWDSFCHIERIQNPALWKSLQIKKHEMEQRNNHQNNEKRLFHGTSEDTVPIINERGFNRSYAGKNATCYGKGSYFAVKADYSAQDTYSKPNAKGEKFMYLCRVLTGDYTLGQKDMIAPPSKGSGVHMYDSVVNDMTNPSMFIVFHDIQAYPEYLITFK
uniref:Poly [ADP-ribose] polymerase n=1 Tax=Poecilia reticulata TaxID=8081 RepID=A0A3P9Q332_POERE